MKRYFIFLAYNGTRYHGWQLQENAHTVQAELNQKLSALLSLPINVTGCGRTDTGVHARSFYAHFDMECAIPDMTQLTYKLNRFLPSDIVVYWIKEVAETLHSRFSAVSRTYRYYIATTKNPFLTGFCMTYDGALNMDNMQQAAKMLKLFDDFTSFSKLHTQTHANICKITESKWQQEPGLLVYTVTADRFLRNMVRAIVGTLFEVGKGKLQPEQIKTIIESKDRANAGFSVPAEGLFLEEVTYPANAFEP